MFVNAEIFWWYTVVLRTAKFFPVGLNFNFIESRTIRFRWTFVQ